MQTKYDNFSNNNEIKNDFSSRLQQVFDNHKLNSLTFSNKVGYKSSEKISRLLRDEKNKPSFEILVDISNEFENLDMRWLLTGKGEMHINNEQSTNNTDNQTVKSELINDSLKNVEIEDLKKQLVELRGQIDELKSDKEDLKRDKKYLQDVIKDLKGQIDDLKKNPSNSPTNVSSKAV